MEFTAERLCGGSQRVCSVSCGRWGSTAIYPRPRTSDPHPDHRIYPYLLRDFVVSAADQVWSADITYVPMQHGFMYLVAILDWHSRYVLAWRLSNTLDSDFCVEALRAALRRGRPAIFNTDQGSQFTSQAFTGVLEQHGIAISMDGRGRALDNVFIERLWWSVKYENVYLHGLRDGGGVEGGLDAVLRPLLSSPAPSVVRQPLSLGRVLRPIDGDKNNEKFGAKISAYGRLRLESTTKEKTHWRLCGRATPGRGVAGR